MAENDLSGRVGLDTTDFKTAIAGMNREIRVIESGFKASAAALGDWGKSADGMEMRIKALSAEMTVQKQKVSALSAEYQRVAAEQGESSRAAQDLEIRLNKETETLNKMGLELNQTEAELNQMGAASTGAATDVNKLEQEENQAVGSTSRLQAALTGLGTKLQSVGSDFRSLGTHVLDVGKKIAVGLAVGIGAAAVGLGALVVKTARTADEMVELGDKTGLTVTQIQELNYIGEQTGTSLETVTGALAKMIRNMASSQKGTGAAADAFKALGVATVDVNGNLLDSQDVFGRALAALGGIANETERDALAMAIFGKSAQELNPLIDLGSEGMAAMSDEAYKLGAIMSEDAVNAAADLNDKLAGLKAGVAGLGAKLVGSFVPIITKVVDKLQEWLANPAVQAGMKRLADGIGKVATAIGNFIGKLLSGDVKGALSQIFPASVVTAVTTIATAIGGFIRDVIIPFVTTHAEEFKGALIAIGAVLAGAGIVAAIASLGAILGTILSPIGLIVAAIALLGAAWAGNWGGIRDTLTAVWTNTIQPALSQLIAWLSVNIPIAIQALSAFWTGTLLPALQAVGNFITTNIVPIFQAIWTWLSVNIPPAIATLSAFWTGTLLPALQAVYAFIQANVMPILNLLWTLIKVSLTLAITALAALWNNVLLPALKAIWNFIQTYLVPIFKTMIEVFNVNVMPVLRVVGAFLSDVLVAAFRAVRDAIQWVIDKIRALTDKLTKLTLPSWLTPGSPTPFELGLIGIGRAMDDLNRKQLPTFTARVNYEGEPPSMSGTVGGGSAQGKNTYVFYGGVQFYGVQNEQDILAALAGLGV